jgi:two-component system response regulator DesR
VIRILLAEDQGMMRGALALLLGLEDDFEVVGQVGAGDRVLAEALESRPDIALLDIEMPGRSGLDVAAELRDALPACKVLILTTFGRPGYLRRAMEAGAGGFLVKDGPVEELAAAIRRVLVGERVVDPALAAAALSTGPNPLTDRERDVLSAAADGSTVADIAGRLHLSESTVRNYLSAAIQKTGSRNRIEAVRSARHNGWL